MSLQFPVYVVEDNALARRTLQRQLDRQGIRSLLLEDGASFLDALPSLEPGIILLDVHLPGHSGVALIDEIAVEHGPFAIVMVSGSVDVDDAIGAFRRGAIHFLRKPYRMAELSLALAEAGEALEAEIAARQRRDVAGKVNLTRREAEVLRELARGHASKVIAFNLDISIRTVEMHRSHIIAKLGAHSASHALAIAQKLGLV